MNDKPTAVLLTTAIAAPVMVVCCLFGPAVIAWAVVWVSGWITGVGAGTSIALAIIAAIVVYGLGRRGRAKPAATNRIGGRTDIAE